MKNFLIVSAIVLGVSAAIFGLGYLALDCGYGEVEHAQGRIVQRIYIPEDTHLVTSTDAEGNLTLTWETDPEEFIIVVDIWESIYRFHVSKSFYHSGQETVYVHRTIGYYSKKPYGWWLD